MSTLGRLRKFLSRKWVAASLGGSLITASILFSTSSGLRNDFVKAVTGVDHDYDGQIIDVPGRSVLVPFNYALKTGVIPDTGIGEASFYRFNIHADDFFGRSYREILQTVKDEIDHDLILQDLLNKETWDRSDRITWEKRVSGYVNKEVDKVDGLGSYRTESDNNEIIRSPNLNDLSFDIRDNSKKYELDCEALATIEGLLLQEVDNHFLPTQTEDENDLRKRASYHYVAGRFSEKDQEKWGAWHAYIMSDLTASIIEATTDPARIFSTRSYKESADETLTFEDFVRGQIFVEKTNGSADADVYGLDISTEQANSARADAKAAQEKDEPSKDQDTPKTANTRSYQHNYPTPFRISQR